MIPLRRRGRPRKFSAPSRPVTLTLPDHVIEALGAIDHDVSRAVVRLAQPQLRKHPHAPAELATFGRRSVIMVNPTPTLEQRTGVVLVHLPDGRALISFDAPNTVADLELLIADALDEHQLSREDEAVFLAIAGILRDARRSGEVRLVQRHIVVLETKRGRRGRGRQTTRRRRRTRGGTGDA